MASRIARDWLDHSPAQLESPSSQPASYATSALAEHDEPFKAALREIEKLKHSLARKDELLRVRNVQMVEVFNAANTRDKLWGLASDRATPESLA